MKGQQRRLLLLLFDCWFSQCCSTGLGFRGVFELDPVTTSRRFSIEFLLPIKTWKFEFVVNKLWGFHSATALKLRSDMKPSIKRSWSSGMILPSGGRGRRFDSGGAPFFFSRSGPMCWTRKTSLVLPRSVRCWKTGQRESSRGVSSMMGFKLLNFTSLLQTTTTQQRNSAAVPSITTKTNTSSSLGIFCTSSSWETLTREFFSQTETENYSIQKSTGARGRVT